MAIRRRKTKLSHNEAYEHNKKVGKEFVKLLRGNQNQTTKLPRFTNPRGGQKASLDKLQYTKSRKPRSTRSFNRTYRGFNKRTDELVSTSSIRGLVEGMLEKAGYGKAKNAAFHKTKFDTDIDAIVKFFSQIRVPTEFVGYSFFDEAMQHPTRRSHAVFTDPKGSESSSLHYYADLDRRSYINDAFDQEIAKGSDLIDIILAGARAAIEFTLNDMMAPLRARNVFNHTKLYKSSLSRKIEADIADNQMAWREWLKHVYITHLKGKLQARPPGETPQRSLKRRWPKNKGKRRRPSFSRTVNLTPT